MLLLSAGGEVVYMCHHQLMREGPNRPRLLTEEKLYGMLHSGTWHPLRCPDCRLQHIESSADIGHPTARDRL